MFKKLSISRIILAALAAAVSVALVGPAQGAPVRPDDRADRAIASAEQAPAVTFDYPDYWGPGTTPIDESVGRPDDRADRTLPFGTSDGGMVTGENKRDVRVGVNYEPTVVASTPQPHRLDWGDAGIGAGGAFGLAILLTALTVAALRYRRPAVS